MSTHNYSQEKMGASLQKCDYYRPQAATVEVKDGIALPFVSGNHAQATVLWSRCHGVLDAHGAYIPSSGICRGYDVQELLPAEIPREEKTAVYLGVMRCDHYGHFLTETVARLWYWQEHCEHREDLVPIFSYEAGGRPKYPRFVREFFELYDEKLFERMQCITQATRYASIIVPAAALGEGWYTEKLLLPYQRAAAHVPPAKLEKVYLSRRKMTNRSLCESFGEEDLETNFVRNGFCSVAMETLSMRDQIATMKGARVVAGLYGTALHNALFCNPLSEIIVLERSSQQETMQNVINQAIQAEAHVCRAYVEPLPMLAPHFGPFLLGMTPSVQGLFKAKGYKDYVGPIRPEKWLREYLAAYDSSCFQQIFAPIMREPRLSFSDMQHYILLHKRSQLSILRRIWLRLLIAVTWGKWRLRYKRELTLRKYRMIRDVASDALSPR